MIHISDEALKNKINNYINSPSGRAALKKRGVHLIDDAELKVAAMELKAMISEAFIAAQTSSNKHFDDRRVKVAIKSIGENKYKAVIQYPSVVLRRYSFITTSMHYQGRNDPFRTEKQIYNQGGYYNGFTGSGVYDIFGLFTKGYDTNKSVYGLWVTMDDGVPYTFRDSGGSRNDIYHNKKHRKPNPFITNTINKFNAKYPNIIVEYPNEWK